MNSVHKKCQKLLSSFFSYLTTVKYCLQMMCKPEMLTISTYYSNILVDAVKKHLRKDSRKRSRIEALTSWILITEDNVVFWCLLYVANRSAPLFGQYLVRISAAVVVLYWGFSSHSSVPPKHAEKQNITAAWQIHTYPPFMTKPSYNSTTYNFCRCKSLIK